MKIIPLNPQKYRAAEIDYLVACFSRGQVLVYPTDTIYGIGCLANDRRGRERIAKIKGRPEGKSFLLLVSSLAMMAKYAKLSLKQRQWIKEQKKPTTVILAGRGNLSQELIALDGSVALRLSSQDYLTKIIRRLSAPLVSSSVNVSGEKPLIEIDEIIRFCEKSAPRLRPDVIVSSSLKGKQPSRLVDIRDMNRIKVLRK